LFSITSLFYLWLTHPASTSPFANPNVANYIFRRLPIPADASGEKASMAIIHPQAHESASIYEKKYLVVGKFIVLSTVSLKARFNHVAVITRL
jgi:hypothetical protein